MSQLRFARVARLAVLAALTLGVFEACSSTTDTGNIAPQGLPVLSFGNPPIDSSKLGCDNTLVVHLDPLYFFLKPPYFCGTQVQCGSLSVSLLETVDGPPLITQRAASANVQLDLTSLVHPSTAQDPTLGQVHFIEAQLIGDSLLPYPASMGSVTQVTTPISLSSGGCPADAGVGDSGASGNAGAAGATSAEGGVGGVGGVTNAGGSGGAGTAGSGGLAGSANEGGADTGAAGSPI